MIPDFTIDGVLPPFQGSDPGQNAFLMSPYEASATEVVEKFGTTDQRQSILKDWLAHRAVLRSVGLVRGFQWLDGSFLEDKEPNDLDIMSFAFRPTGAEDDISWINFANRNLDILLRDRIRQRYKLDVFVLDLDGDKEMLVSTSRYFLQLFSHQRNTFLWKGMLQVRMEDTQDDDSARLLLAADQSTLSGGLT